MYWICRDVLSPSGTVPWRADVGTESAGAPSPRILLVEDIPADAELIARELRRAGVGGRLQRVETRADYIRTLHEFAPDLIIADHSLPSFSASDALEMAQREGAGVPVIVVTGSLDEETAADYIKAGAADYIVKSHLERLGPAVLRALDLNRARAEQARAQEQLRQSEARYRTLVDGVRDVIFALAPDGTIASLNPAFETITGFPRDEWLGRPFEQLVHSDDLPLALELLSGVARGEPRPVNQFRIRTRKGDYRMGEFAATPQYREGQLASILGIGRDVTERLSLEQQLRQAQKMEAVGRLAGGVAHDFNNILTAITGYADLLLEDLGTTDRRRDDIAEIRKAAERAAGLTRQLLAFSRQQVMQVRVLDLNDVVADTQNMLGRLLGEDIALVTRLDPALGAVKADPGQLEQVIMNLAVNARDAMPGGGKLTIETANAELDDTYVREHFPARPGSYVMLAVSDTGTGMSDEVQSHLFEPFFTTKEKGKGTGLGLATVYGIVKQSGGYIWVYTEPGHGTTFKIYLPRVAGAPAQRASGPKASPVGAGTETVLLAEDEAAVRAVARHALERQGYTVLEASSGEAALDLAERHSGRIHLLLTDVIMPGMNGRALALRLSELRPDLRVVYMSGYTEEAITRHGVLEPGLTYVQKPFTPEGLARKVREVLDRQEK
ncbi:MAG: hybrid sensor histidine kinase/response regulator [Gemmatimonadetes bacterium]|nr:MAG: hybrid sensor histidine kinase/response regulator [Gemmatimonadota bacterium]